MRLRGTRGDTEALAQLVIREAGGEQFHDLPLALCEARRGGSRRHARDATSRLPGGLLTEGRNRLPLRRSGDVSGAGESRLVAPQLRLLQLLRVQRPDPLQQLEL